jgi:phosphatidylinositol 4-phosphatase
MFIRRFLARNDFIFSYTYDLTHTLQRISRMTPEQHSQPLWQRADDRFFWNKYAMRTLIQLTRSRKCDLSDYILPICQAFVRSVPIKLNESSFDYILISRRNCYRAGTRFHTRGVDELGHVANNVETEQIVYFDGILLSHVQTRGSIPLFWRQNANLRYSPLKEIEENPLAEQAFRLHFDKQLDIYGDQIVVNLVDKKGSEQRLAEQFRALIEEKMRDKSVKYVHFDFHHECRRMQWQNISKLINQIENELEAQGYFMMDKTGDVVCSQSSVVRTNCIDCLDRTNVVQSLLARRVLLEQLQRLDILAPGDTLENYPEFESLIRNSKNYARLGCHELLCVRS